MTERNDLLRSLLDRSEIGEVLVRYGTALDTRDAALLESCFTADAILEFDALPVATRDQFVERCQNLDRFTATQHIVANIAVRLDGDTAESTAYAHAMHVWAEDGGRETYLLAGTYTDRWMRTPDGWRIAHRRFRGSWATKSVDVLSPTYHRQAPGT
jgi:hypothetical protein